MNDNREMLLREALSVINHNNNNNICIVSHVNPDGDSIGSVLALGLALKRNGYRNITMLIPDEIPNNLMFLLGIDLIQKEISVEKIDLLIALDCGDMERIGINKALLESIDFIINIDHHVTNKGFGDINVVDPCSSSTGEMIYRFLELMKVKLDKDIATSLYVAISTDTGSFKYDNTTPVTHMIVSGLLNIGIDINLININLYQSRSIEKTNLLIASLNTLELLKHKKIALVVVTREMIRKCNATINDADIIIDFIRDIDGVEIACIIKEIDDKLIKVSFRSKNYADVSVIAKNFNGGGHVKASGCTLYSSIEEGKILILEEIEKALR
ncbi:bifunctional oligoribonuclease/PAP phosphatase NrnA [Proteiniborus sp. MB09-C3]|uniref:DHH family phosphoesterase n=1 Tax=Proteiniborus sp. MB09-C3 TaxID=3050072 RepID=UPI002555CD91|nr:bifunctional oligoribonuclease/PAP phosphatase NrnA [Proteiniborus sp. MB09-C3]WIV10904.1 bifunctional oligoribonuclease/PAP phosphatase NrnA [Proteiniborus sp. MB09-C3]